MRGAVVGSFMGCQRGKRDIAVDLKQPEGLEIALRLVASADMVHHNMTKGTAERLGVGYEQCRAVNPEVLYCNVYMYGAFGPLSHMGGLDPLAQAASGIEWEEGPVAAGNPPLWYRYGHGDVAAAMPSVLALLIALVPSGPHRQGPVRVGVAVPRRPDLHSRLLARSRRLPCTPPCSRRWPARPGPPLPALRDRRRVAPAGRRGRGALAASVHCGPPAGAGG